MSKTADAATRTEPVTSDAPKNRDCLRCRAAFLSAWAGERICGRCRSSDAWRKGSPIPTYSGGGRKR